MSGYFDFSWTTNHLLYPLLYSISYCIRFYSYKQLSPNQNNPVFFSLIMGFAEISNILFELIIIYRTKQKEKRSLKFIVNNEIIKEEKEKKSEHTFSFFLLIIIVITALLDLFSSVIINYLITDQAYSLSLILRITQILFLSLLMRLCLNQLFYIHHILSLFIILVSIIALIILDGNYYKWNFILSYLGSYLLNSIRYILFKHIIEKYYCSPFIILFESGISILIIVSLVILFSTIENIELFAFEATIRVPLTAILENKKGIFYTVLIYLFGIFINGLGLLINQELTPCHLGIADILNALFLFIVNMIYEDKEFLSLLKLIISIMIFISCLVFTEIVICKCCGLDQFTVKEIQKRAVDDKEIICQFDEKPLLKNEIIL